MMARARTSTLTGIDHLVIGAPQLEDARGAWARIGFTITPQGRHEAFGTANYCILFPDDYVELLGIADPELVPEDLARRIAAPAGFNALAFGTPDAEKARAALGQAGIAVEGPRGQTQIIETPRMKTRLAFRLLRLPPEATPGFSAFVCQHLTRKLLWRPSWCDHPNGARGIAALTLAVADPSAVAIPYGVLFGFDCVKVADGFVAVSCGGTSLRFALPEALPRLHPLLGETRPPALPWLAGVEIRVGDPADTARFLEEVNLPHWRLGESRIGMAPLEPGGIALDFVAG